MDFIDILKQFAARTEELKSNILTEEATKTSLVMPFFQQVFGYDIFNPNEFVPEFTADVGTKKGEKVDYCIMLDGSPVILIEVKWSGISLERHDSQLFRYFGTTTAKYGILTNGINYKFYTDLKEQNKMDLDPFLEINLSDIKDVIVPELKQFCRANFNIDQIFARASELKHSSDIRKYFLELLNEPSDDFVKFMLAHTYDGSRTQNVIEKFKPIVKSTLNNLISEMMNEKITTALKSDSASFTEQPSTVVNSSQDEDSENKVIMTEEKLSAFYLVKSILQIEGIDISRIRHQDFASYFVILVDNSTSNWICRLRLGNSELSRIKKSIALPSDDRKEIRYELNSLDDIYVHKDEIIASANELLQHCKKKQIPHSESA